MTDRDSRILALLVGDLPEEERDALEERLFEDDDLLASLLAVEEALAEAALDGTLPPDLAPRLTGGGKPGAALERAIASTRLLRSAPRVGEGLALVLAALASRGLVRVRLRPGLERGAAGPADLAIPPGTGSVVLELEAPGLAGVASSEATVELETADGAPLATAAGLPIAVVEGVPRVVAAFDPSILRPGLVRAKLAAALASGTFEEIDDYFFRVLPGSS